jgi:hypothetical protein
MRTTPPWVGNVLGHVPQLTPNWGPFRAFLAVVGIAAMIAAAARPEAAYILATIYFIAVIAAMIGAYKNWLH